MAVGTLTALRAPAPARVDRRTAGMAMVLAPLAGGLVAAPAVGLVLAGRWLDAQPLLVAALAVAATALASRGLHLDGLADTTDGLAASYDRQRALAVMRRGDTGPAGLAALGLVLLVQVAALAAVLARPDAAVAVLVAVVTGRSVLSLACARGVPAARGEGLGATVAGSVPPVAAAAVAAATAGLAAAVVSPWWHGAAAVVAGYAAAGWLLSRCLRRLGGVTGDVLGGCVELAVTAGLVVLAVA
ncbi:MAG: adenosylcobinamide-GDP ribazoletransferase [Micromonosporaceae bacterium]|nr:adenosylcobinamide-GDP ribazoletransferase [Micromonosporaceae bacterium]